VSQTTATGNPWPGGSRGGGGGWKTAASRFNRAPIAFSSPHCNQCLFSSHEVCATPSSTTASLVVIGVLVLPGVSPAIGVEMSEPRQPGGGKGGGDFSAGLGEDVHKHERRLGLCSILLEETFPTQRNPRQKIPSADCKTEESLLACIVLSPMMQEEPDPPRIPRPSSWNSVSSKAIGRNPAVSEWTQVTIHGAVMEVGGAQTA